MAKRISRNRQDAAPVVRNDSGYAQAFLGGRPRHMNYSAELIGSGYLLPQPVLQSYYMSGGYGRLICDKPAEEMTRAGFSIEDLDPSLVDAIQARFEELEIVKRMNEALKWRRAFGGSLIVLGLKDGGTLEVAVNEESITEIEFLRVYDCFEATVEGRYEDPNDPKFGDVEYWKVAPKQGGTSYIVHESRCLVFDGESIPNEIRLQNNGWGASVIQTCVKQLNDLSNAHKWATLLLERMQQAVYGIKDLATLVETKEGQDQVTARMNIADTVRNSLNMLAIDAEGETFTVNSLSLSGVTDVVDRKSEALSAVCEIPMFVLMGRSVGGMNSTGEANRDAWYAKVHAMQINELKKPLDRLISFQMRIESKGDTDGGDYTLTFNPLSTPSDKDQSEIDYKNAQTKKTEADTLKIYADLGSIDENEIRKQIAEEYELEGDAPEPIEEAPKPVVLNPGQTLVDPTPGATGLPVGT